ncbi:hypothetical protein BDN71DRAFT_1383328 [Pleurotus eryngii]|uniref:Copper acquisition factor BIM1-like domain-containing protein n=1 Tax=Pleurotus eryngii TaxID=5323 RepID=A0A9P6DB00_PLEER|nr:hypothetical protein BDN71DRAFT_1383328 [Pleurotus eryngii]
MFKLYALALITSFAGVANAHFRLLYPEPRGPFVSDQEPNFCGGYTNVTPNRTAFPISGGFYSIRTGHGGTIGVMVSTVQNPNNFDNFSSASGEPQFVNAFQSSPDAGVLCFPLDFSQSNITGVRDGANVTVQVVVAGSDGSLYQCADLTLSSNATTSFTCANETTSSHDSGSNSSSTAGGSSDSSNNNSGLGRASTLSAYAAGAMAVVGIMAATTLNTMRLALQTLLFAALAGLASAHFQLQFPAPRGAFVEDQEPTFCGKHPHWFGVLVSTAANPTSFDNFSQALPFTQLTGEGAFCLPLNFATSNVTGLSEGQNVTIQIQFDGGDSPLFQCADVTLTNNASLSSVSCTNATQQGTNGGVSAHHDTLGITPMLLAVFLMISGWTL